jgi:hypothetical protein
MKTLSLIVGAAALAFAGPALAKPGKGHGVGHGKSKVHQIVPGGNIGYGVGGCPPGLAKKAVPCVPPGQAKKMFDIGHRVPLGYQGLLGYNGLPNTLRSYYGAQLDPRSRYIYDDSYIYRVDPRTMLVQQVLSAILR